MNFYESSQFSRSVVSNSLWSHGLQHARLPSLSITNSQTLVKLMPIESVMPSNHLILCHPLLLLPSFPASGSFLSEFLTSVQFSCSVMSDSAILWTAAGQASLSITNSQSLPNSCPLSWWCQPTISSSVVPFSSCLQSFLVSRSFQMNQLFASGDQSIGVSASTSVLPMNTQDWSPLEWTGWISLQSKGLSRVSSNTTVQKHQLLTALSLLYGPTLTSIHDCWKNHSLD